MTAAPRRTACHAKRCRRWPSRSVADRSTGRCPGWADLRPEWVRSRIYESFLDLLRRLAVNGPVVLAIEDLHWADDSTRGFGALRPQRQAERLLLIVTFRSDELTRRHPLLFWLAETDRAPGVERRAGEAGSGAGRASAGEHPGAVPGPALVESVYERSEGNPFFAEELVAAGAAAWLPVTLREVLAARLAHVGADDAAARGRRGCGRKVDHDLLARLTELSERELYDSIEEAVAAQLLVVDRAW